MISRLTRAVLLGTLAIAAGCTKIRVSVPPPPAAFLEASVEPVGVGTERNPYTGFTANGKFFAEAPLIDVIGAGYDIPYPGLTQVLIAGGPDWARSASERWSITAIPQSGALPPGITQGARHERSRLMLRKLLAERFGLRIRTETQTMPVYAIAIAKGGPKLERAEFAPRYCPLFSQDPRGACHTLSGGQGRGVHGHAATIADLANFVEHWTTRPLVDKTGLKGLYRFDTENWVPMSLERRPAPGTKAEDDRDFADVPSIFAVFHRLGLELKSQHAQTDIYVIEHVEKPLASGSSKSSQSAAEASGALKGTAGI